MIHEPMPTMADPSLLCEISAETTAPPRDAIRPSRYTHPSGVECWQISSHLPHPLGAAFEYVWRYRDKGAPVDDLRKALQWLQFERVRRTEVTTQQRTTPAALDRFRRVHEHGHHAGDALHLIVMSAISWMQDELLQAAEHEVRKLLHLELGAG